MTIAMSALSVQAAVNLTVDQSSFLVRPGEQFTVTLYLEITGGEKVTGFDFYWAADEAGSGLFALSDRDVTESPFDFQFLELPAPDSPDNLLDPSNATDLGAGFSDIYRVATVGTWLIARYTFAVSSSAEGSFVLTTISDSGSGWVTDAAGDFRSYAFDRHAAVDVMVSLIPEEGVSALNMGTIAMGIVMIILLSKRRFHE